MFSGKSGTHKLQDRLQALQQKHQLELQEKDAQLEEKQSKIERLESHLTHLTSQASTATSLRGGEMLHAIREGMANSSNSLVEERKALKLLDDIFGQTRSAVERLKVRAEAIKNQAKGSLEKSQTLEATAHNIGQLVSSIKEISDQTNLLSLNAAIEAARAGEHGRGFAVVADEVRQLANKAKDASEQIDFLVTNIIRQTVQIKAHVDDNLAGAEEVSASSVQINSMVEEVIYRSEHMQKVIYKITTVSFLNTVKLDHAVWKNEVYQRIQQERFDELMVDHCNCRLGKWYFEGYGSRKYQHLQSFQNIDAPHRAVHTYGNQALEAGGRGDHEAMSAALVAMEDTSRQVVHYLDALEQDIAVK